MSRELGKWINSIREAMTMLRIMKHEQSKLDAIELLEKLDGDLWNIIDYDKDR